MKQILQSLKNGKIYLENLPSANAMKNHLLIQTTTSLISSGTERMLLNFGKAGVIGKMRQQPEKVKEVFQKIKTDGLLTTFDTVKNKLDQPIALGYCHVGRVLEVGEGIIGFTKGDRILSNAPHAEIVQAPKNLCVKIPNNVTDEEASFGILGAIGLQGIRLASPTLGEYFVVMGLGLVGLLTAQLLQAQGCYVLGIEFDEARCQLAKSFGIQVVNPSSGESVLSIAEIFSRGRGVDGVLITASTESNEPIHQAAMMCRKRGRIILVGVSGLELSRADFYEKELTFQVSCSYGPGRYDMNYEEKGQDYPFGFVRWTEQRNIEAVLDMMSQGRINVKSLITHRVNFEEAEQAYALLDNPAALGIILQYSAINQSFEKTITLNPMTIHAAPVVLAFLGAGNYASRILIPAFKTTKALLHTIISGKGLSSAIHGRKHGFIHASTEYDAILKNNEINAVVIATRHQQHAEQTIQALILGKHVFVEKPLVITQAQLEKIKQCYEELNKKTSTPLLMVGFNRRFSLHAQKIKSLLAPIAAPKNFVMTVNSGFIPSHHWTQDPEVGGGRLIGETCHFVDLLRFLADSTITNATISTLSHSSPCDENITITLQFSDGSQGTIHYFANGHKAVSKERLEIFTNGKIIQLDNFRKMHTYGFKKFSKLNLWRQDKGQQQCAHAFVEAITHGKESPIPFEELIEVHRVCLQLAALIKN